MEDEYRAGVVAILRDLPDVVDVGSGEVAREGDYPYIQTQWNITTSKSLAGDGRAMAGRIEDQFSIWEKGIEEDGNLALAVIGALNGAKVAGHRLSFYHSNRTELEGDIVHTVVSVTRQVFTPGG